MPYLIFVFINQFPISSIIPSTTSTTAATIFGQNSVNSLLSKQYCTLSLCERHSQAIQAPTVNNATFAKNNLLLFLCVSFINPFTKILIFKEKYICWCSIRVINFFIRICFYNLKISICVFIYHFVPKINRCLVMRMKL